MPETSHTSDTGLGKIRAVGGNRGRGIFVTTGVGPTTAGDRKDAHDLLALRMCLLEQPEIQFKLAELGRMRRRLGASAPVYRFAVEHMSRLTDGQLCPGYLDELAQAAYDGTNASSGAIVLLQAGRPGRARARTRSAATISMVARSIALRVDGAGTIQADQQAGPEYSSPDLVTKHRRNLARDLNAARVDASYKRRWADVPAI